MNGTLILWFAHPMEKQLQCTRMVLMHSLESSLFLWQKVATCTCGSHCIWAHSTMTLVDSVTFKILGESSFILTNNLQQLTLLAKTESNLKYCKFHLTPFWTSAMQFNSFLCVHAVKEGKWYWHQWKYNHIWRSTQFGKYWTLSSFSHCQSFYMCTWSCLTI